MFSLGRGHFEGVGAWCFIDFIWCGAALLISFGAELKSGMVERCDESGKCEAKRQR